MSNVIPLTGKNTTTSRDQWMERGACRTSPLGPDAWFPEPGDTKSETAKAARRTCHGVCPVSQECLLFALATNERHGIWGGMGPDQRARFAREAREHRGGQGDEGGAAA
jgi:WhiB family transcriptional regulator, redox-sensing transcriptional regulator